MHIEPHLYDQYPTENIAWLDEQLAVPDIGEQQHNLGK